MVAVNHIPHLVHTQTAFVWRFLALSAGESQIIHVTAWTEREARSRCPSGCVAVFAARIRQGNLCTIKPHRTQPPPRSLR
ncbi:host cell division inhibitor Icd-like protein [Escherichia coli]|nr:host cell division inhibitor Icd-like protein [Escherichia coli]MDW9199366.1 host cell division inhibitor Icd-like protein [Escherichia coli]MDW9215003.1 host cell division inhibitor Icd-like protein [Escherichia coli]